MAYSQPDDIRNALAPGVWPVGDDDPTPTTRTAADLADGQLATEIAQADQLIDGYIGKYYATPVADSDLGNTPIKTWSTNIAAYLGTLTYRKGKDLSAQDPVALRYALTLAQLVGVNKGQITLQLPGNTGSSDASGAGAPINPYVGALFGQNDFDLRPGWSDNSGRPWRVAGVTGEPVGQLTAQQVQWMLQGQADDA